MKKLIVILMALALAMAAFTACAGNVGNDSPADNGNSDIGADNSDGDSDLDEPTKPDEKDDKTESDKTEPDQPGDSSEKFLKTITEETATAKGVCGPDLTWYYKEGVLVIKGTGEMTDYYSDAFENKYAPWVTYNDGEIKNEISWVILGDGVTSVGSLAFYGLDLLSKAVLPDSLEKIGEGAFYHCVNLTSIDFPDSLEVIGDEAFSCCGNLTSVDFPKSLKEIGRSAFKECRGLTSITIPATVEEIGLNAFHDCENANLTLPEGITQINEGNAFGGTRSITIPASVTKIEEFGFQYEITFLGDAPEITTLEFKTLADEVVGTVIKGLPSGFNNSGEPCETGVTFYYSGKGFEKYIEMCPQYHWVKK